MCLQDYLAVGDMSTLKVNNLNLHTRVKLGKSTGPLPSRIEARSAGFHALGPQMRLWSQIQTRALAPQQSRVKRYQTASTFELSTRLSETGPIMAPRPRRRIKRAYWQSRGQQQRSQFNVYRNSAFFRV